MSLGANKQALMGASGAGGAGGDFYTHQIANSLRNSAAQNGNLTFTAGTPTSSTTMTMSYWVKRYDNNTNSPDLNIFVTGTGGASYFIMGFASNAWQFQPYGGSWGSTGGITMDTTALYRDTSSWYHHVIIWDTSQAVQANRVRMYVNGEQITSFSAEGVTGQLTLNESLSYINQSGVVQAFGGLAGKGHGTVGADLQMAEIVFIDGLALTPTSFGESKNGVWIPKDPSTLTFGNNGYWLKFESSSDLGNDSSGNNNDFTATNLATHDQMLGSPTFSATDGNGGNFCNIGGLEKNTGGFTFSEGNLKYAVSTNDRGFIFSQGVPESGKYYWEVRATQFGGTQDQLFIGVCEPDKSRGNLTASRGGAETSGAGNYVFDNYNGRANLDGTAQSNDSVGYARSVPQTFGFAIDRDNNTFKWTYDGSSYSSTYTIPSSGVLAPFIGSGGGSNTASGVFNFGADSTFAGLVTAGGNADENGYGNFSLAVPSGYLALCAANLPTADAVDPAQTDDDYPQKLFSPLIWTGDGNTSRAITGLGFQPDWLWFKSRSSAFSNRLYDTTRGISGTGGKRLFSDTTGLQVDQTSGQDISAVGTDGFTTGASSANYTNDTNSGGLQAGWFWRANGGTTSTNTQGSEDSTVQADPSGSFSIVKWTGTNSSWGNAITLGHGLSSAPTCIIAKQYTGNADEWTVFFSDLGGAGSGANAACNSLVLNTAAALYTNQSYKSFGGVMPTLSPPVFTVDGNNLNRSSSLIIAYCFANTEGFIKAGSYIANGNADNAFVYTGFRPAFLLTKGSVDSTSASWQIIDNKRPGYNVEQHESLDPSSYYMLLKQQQIHDADYT